MKIIWISANKFGFEVLKTVSHLENIEISGIVTLDSESNIIMYDRIPNENWQQFNSDIIEVKNILESEPFIKRNNPDLIVVAGWREIIKPSILNIPRFGVVSFHPTLLPFGRGPAPIINSILENVSETGVTMFYLDKDLDSGDIIGQIQFRINQKDYADDVYKKVIETGRKLVIKYLPMIAEGTAPRRPQDQAKAYYFKKPGLKNNKLKLDKESPERIIRKIRALSKPYKGAYIRLNGKKLRIWRADLEDE